MKRFLITGVMVSLFFAKPLTGKQILDRVDKNFKSQNSISIATMIIHGRRGARRVTSKTWMQGRNKAFTKYLSPAREKGTKMLKLENELWIYSPMSDRIIKIAGHMLRQSVMGSDLSYEDYMEEYRLSDMYRADVLGEELIEDRACYKIQLVALKRGLAYHSRLLWVDKERYLPLREDRFAKSGKLLKRFQIKEVFRIESRWYPKRAIYKDMLKSGKGTELVFEKIEFNTNIPFYIFSKASLRR